jgi:hypothetical protein
MSKARRRTRVKPTAEHAATLRFIGRAIRDGGDWMTIQTLRNTWARHCFAAARRLELLRILEG